MNTRNQRTRQSGFSLIELIVVITIIGILATMVVINTVGHTDEAKITKVKNDFGAIETACSMFRTHHDRWPDSLEELMNPPERPNGMRSQKYLKKTPKDPWTGEIYLYDIDDDGPLLISYGADQSEGGEAENADISNRDEEGSSF